MRNSAYHPAESLDVREVPEGVQSEVIFAFDLELPREFMPHNEDGEVAELQSGSGGMLYVGFVSFSPHRAHIVEDAECMISVFNRVVGNAISAERRIKHPAVLAISAAAFVFLCVLRKYLPEGITEKEKAVLRNLEENNL